MRKKTRFKIGNHVFTSSSSTKLAGDSATHPATKINLNTKQHGKLEKHGTIKHIKRGKQLIPTQEEQKHMKLKPSVSYQLRCAIHSN